MRYGPEHIDWVIPIFIFTTLFTLRVGPGQTLFTYFLADPQVRGRRWWFLFYLVASSFFYTPLKNLIGVVAQVKELMGERVWNVTPRPSANAPERGKTRV